MVWVDGHSDYGHALTVFWERWGEEITPRTSVLLLGDARNNYHASQAWVVKEIRARARHVYWLNPEPRAYWDSGDSIVGEYAVHCDEVVECRTLRQLEQLRGRAGVSGRTGSTPSPGPGAGAPDGPSPRRLRPGSGPSPRRTAGHPDRPGPPRRGGVQRVGRVRRADRVHRADRPGPRPGRAVLRDRLSRPGSWPGPTPSTPASCPGPSRRPSCWHRPWSADPASGRPGRRPSV